MFLSLMVPAGATSVVSLRSATPAVVSLGGLLPGLPLIRVGIGMPTAAG